MRSMTRRTPRSLPLAGAPECTSCGICCTSTMARYVRLFESDVERLGERLDQYAHLIDGHYYLRMEGGRCVALGVTRLGVACTIYDERPCVCRELARGSFECRAQIDEKAPIRFPP